MVVHFVDPALLAPRDPPAAPAGSAGGRFSSLRAGTGVVVGRIILSSERRRARPDALSCCVLAQQCNGAVLDARAWTLLAVPPRAFAPRPPARVVDGHLAAGLYDIIQVSDGTVVTLYRWEHPLKGPIWCLASGNGYDVSHLKWMGDLAYAEVLHELLAKNAEFVAAAGPRLLRGHLGETDVRLDFASLDPSVCYTVGFRHRNFHPMGADPPAVWNIQTGDLATGAPRHGPGSGGLPGVPRQATFSPGDIHRLRGARSDAPPGAIPPPVTVAALEEINRTAFEEAKAAVAKGPPFGGPLPEAAGLHVCPFNYGFILRSRDLRATGPHSDVLCETALLRRVRQLVYQRPPRQVRDELDHGSRLEYSALRAFLSVTDRADFLALFPGFAPRFADYGQFVDNIIHMVIHMHRQNQMAPGARAEDEAFPRTRSATIAKAVLTLILSCEKSFRVFHSDAKSIVHDFVVRQEYALLYLRALGVGPSKA